jgi:hypothetical protein
MFRPCVLLLFICSLGHADSVICCGTERVFIVDESGREQWSWQASDSPQIPAEAQALFRNTDECKPIGGFILITSSSGGVALIHRSSKHCAFYTRARNAHSACLLPGMRVAVAASTGGDHLYIFNRRKSGLSAPPLKAIPLKGAHGVTWDAARETCWALGQSVLLKLDRNLQITETFQLPSQGGHDLSPAKEGELFVTTNSAAYRFRVSTGVFTKDVELGGLARVKSIDLHPESGERVWQQAELDHSWGHRLRFSKRAPMHLPDQRLYKLRWDAPRPTPEHEIVGALKKRGITVFEADGHVRELVANQLEIQDEDLHLVGWLPFITDLSLEQTAITDAGIAHLAGCDRLEWLNLWKTRIGDGALKLIGGMKHLRHLPIGGTLISDAGIKHLGGLKDLVYLGLRETQVSDAGIRQLAGLTRLESLNLMHTRVSDASIPVIIGLQQLKTLRLEGSRISEAGVGKLRAALPACVVVF